MKKKKKTEVRHFIFMLLLPETPAIPWQANGALKYELPASPRSVLRKLRFIGIRD